ncbi:MAG: hypothetical protein K6L80_09220 [Agarilytica sp.]
MGDVNIFRVLTIILVILSISCSQKGLTPEEAVYESLFLKIIGNTYERIFLIRSTDLKWSESFKIDEVKKLNEKVGIDTALIEKLYTINSRQHSIAWRPIMVAIEMLPSSIHESESKDERCGLTPSNRKYRGYYTVSRVAFSQDSRSALVKYGYHCAPLSGATEQLVLLKKEGKQWVVSKGIRLWVS